MDLEARIIALTTYCIILLVVVFGIEKFHKKYIKYILIAYALFLSIIAFFYVPMKSADLYRLIPIMNSYAKMDIDELSYIILTSNMTTPGVPIYYYLIGQLGNNGFLAGITALLVYGVCFTILYDCYKKHRINNKHLSLILLLFMSRGLFLIIISNVRTGISVALISWCIYHEMLNKKAMLKNLPIYLIACSIHVVGQIAFIIRIIFENIYLKNKNVRMWHIIISAIIALATLYFGVRYGALDNLSGKAENYFVKFATGTGYTYFWEALINWLFIGGYIYILKIRDKISAYSIQKGKSFDDKIKAFIKLLIVIDMVAFFIEYNFFYRLGWLLSMLYIPMLIHTFKIAEDNNMYTAKLYNNILLFSLMALALECMRGDLCGLKFW